MKLLIIYIVTICILIGSVNAQSTCPTISTVTSSSFVCKGSNFTLSVTAVSPDKSALTYEWYKNNILVGTRSQYIISGFTQTDEAAYYVKVSNDCGTATSSSTIQLTLADVPSITAISNAVLCEGASQTIAPIISSNNGGALIYSWTKNAVLIPTQTQSTISFSPVTASSNGNYAIAASNSCGISSSFFNVSVKQIPLISVQPVATQALCTNGNLELSVSATTNGTDIINYQWYKDAVLIPGATSSKYTKNAVTISDAGNYTVILQNSCSYSQTSTTSVVTVGDIPLISVQPVSNSLCVGSNAAVFNVTANSNGGGLLNYQWLNAGIPINGATNSIYSITGVKSSDASTSYSVRVSNTCGVSSNTSSVVSLTVNETPSVLIVSDKTTYCTGTSGNINFTSTVSGTGLTYTWYKGQTVVGSNSASLLANYSSSSIDGIYSLKVTNSCGQSTSNNITIQSGALPVITTDLKDSVVCSSSSITMSVIADNKNAGALSYIWTGPGIITNTNQSQYTIPSFTADLNGSYTVSVTNSCGTVASKTVNIAVQTALAISSQPQTAIVCKGGSNTLSVTMSANSNPLKYSWYFNNNSIPNANSANLNLSNITTNNVGSYKVQVSTTCGAIVSNAAEISIYDAPIFSVSPTIIYPLCENGSLSLNGSITSANNGTLAPYNFVWKHNGSSMSGNNISVTGSNTSLAIANVANTDKGVYQIVVTDACGNTQLSNTATVQINAIPTFTLNPSSVNICVTQSALLQSNAQNTNGSNLPITYQWYLNTTPIGSATNNNYNLVSMSPAAQGNYHVIATNQCGSITSADAVVNNISLPNLISVTPDLALCFSSSQTRTLTVNTNTTNGLAPTVVWTTDAGSIQGTNIGTTINIAATATNARYTYTLTNACGVYRDVQNNLPFVTVYSEQAAPVVSDYTKAPNTTFCQYANMPLFVQTLSTAALFEYYTWKLNGNIVQNSTNINSKFYTKNVLAPSDAGNYSVDITNSCGTKSDAAFIPVIINPSPSIDFSVTSTVSQCLGGNVFTFLNTSTNTGGNIKYVWDFGDGAFDNTNVTTASHTYSVIGEQTVVLRGTNDYGCTNLNTHKVYVQSSPSILVQPIGGTVCEGSKFVLSAAVSSSFANSVSYQWYNGQNAISGANLNTYTIVSMSLTDAGSYTLQVANAACNSSVTTTPVNINFLETPRTSFISDPNAIPACLKDATFKFTNTTPVLTGGTATYTWTYSDGSIDNNINSTHQFTSVGNYSVSLQAFNGGCTSTPIVLNNIIINGPPIISNNISTSQAIASGTPSTNLVVTATSNTGNGTPSVINYQWYQSQSSLVGSTANTYNISNMSLANVGDYYVLVSNGCGTVKSNVDHITMVSAPIITTQPIDQQVCIGKSVSLAAAAISGDGSNPMYQWYFQASPSDPQQSIIGATNAIYNIASFSNINVGYYFVAIKNTIGTVNSNIVFISDETAPIINSLATIPSSTNGLCINSDLRFNVQFQSKRSSAYTVTWMQNTTVLNQQTQLQLNLTNLQIANSGNYIVQVSNVCGVANDTIPVTVVNKPVFASSLSPQIKCIGTQLNLTAALVATNNNLPLSFQWIKDGLRYAGLGVQADNSITINNLQLVDSGQYALQVSNVCGLSSTNTVKVLIVQNPVITKQPVSVNACVGNSSSTQILASSADNQLSYQWYKNGILMPSVISNQLNIGLLTTADNATYKAVISNSCNLSVSSNEFQLAVNDVINLKTGIANKNLCVGTSAIFDLSNALNNIDLNTTYQWVLNGLNIPVSTAQSVALQIPTISNSSSGKYSLLTSNSCGTSQVALFDLAVTDKPTIITQPISASICEGNNFVNSILVSNPSNFPFSYQWNLAGNAIVGATGSQFIVGNASIKDQGMYSVTLTNACGTIISGIGSLTVRSKPLAQINTLSPLAQCLSNNSFNYNAIVNLTDNSVPYIVWDLGDGVFGNTSQIIHSYKSANDFNVYLYAKSMFGCIDTVSQAISVNTIPLILSQTGDQNICSGGTVNLNVNVKLKPNEQVGYQWYYNDQIITGALNSVFSIPVVNASSSGSYNAIVQNACGIIASNKLQLKIADKPLITIPMPDSAKICLNTAYSLKPIVYSLLPNTYQWYKNNLPIVGQSNDSLLFNSFSSLDNAKYRVAISNSCGSINSALASLVVRNIPSSNQVLFSDTICKLTNYSLNHNNFNLINNDDSIRYQWFKNGVLIPGKVAFNMGITKFTIVDTGFYAIQLGNNCGSSNVPIAKLSLNNPLSGYVYDTIGACANKLLVTLKDSSNTIFPISNYYWHVVENNTTLLNAAITNYQFVNPGKYNILHSIRDIKGCYSDTISYSFTNFGKPTANFTIADTCLTKPSIAVDNSLVGFGNTKMISYKWDYGDTIITNNNPIPNLYVYKTPGKKLVRLTVSSDSSCVTDTISKSIMIYGNPSSSFITMDSCQGFPVLFTSISKSIYYPDSVGSYLWKFGDSTTAVLKNPQHVFSNYGSYKINLTSYSATCPFLSTDTTINFRVKPPRADSVYPIIHAVKLIPTKLHALNGGRSYQWNPITGLSDSQIQDPFSSITGGKLIYSIKIVDSAGCVLNDKQEVWAFSQPDIYLATAFSPNGDGINDYYQPQYVDIINLEYFRIFDKNNRLIFSANKLTDKWDGKVNGNSVASDAYIVSVSGIDINGNRIAKQSVIILVK